MIMSSYSFLCLFGISFLPIFDCQDCVAGNTFPVFVNISDNATFSMQANESHRFFEIEMLRTVGNISRTLLICHIFDWDDILHPFILDRRYRDRMVLSIDKLAPDGLRNYNVTIVDIQPDDNGTYIIQAPLRSNQTCFIIYVLGQPLIDASVTPTVIEEGSGGHFLCAATSTTIPPSHNLTLFVSLYIDGTLIAISGKNNVASNTLSIRRNGMTRADDGLVFDCHAREEKGLITSTSKSVIMNWGPDPGPILQPPDMYYYIEDRKAIYGINCSTDCKPECHISWSKAGNETVVSSNGLLSPGSITDTNAGEYICSATRRGTIKRATKSIFILQTSRKGDLDPGLTLTPSRSYYHVEVGTSIPDIRCSSDCKTYCGISWRKAETHSIVSIGGILSIGQVTEEQAGEYVCSATSHGPFKTASKSVFILLKEKEENVPQTLAIAGVALSAAALLLAVGAVMLIFRQRLCSLKLFNKGNKADDSALQNKAYEDLKGTRAPTSGQETYDALALGTFEESSNGGQEARSTGVYENNRLN